MKKLANIENFQEEKGKKVLPEEYFELKTRIHDRLLDQIDLSLIDKLDQDTLRRELRGFVERALQQEGANLPLNAAERERLLTEIQDEVLGLGPLEPFLQDPTVSDILVNTFKRIYVERFGKLELTDARFKDDAHLRKIIDKIVSSVGRRIDESSPMVDARLKDGSRVNAVIPPLAIDGPMLSIRRFSVDPLEMEDLIRFKTLTPEIGAAVGDHADLVATLDLAVREIDDMTEQAADRSAQDMEDLHAVSLPGLAFTGGTRDFRPPAIARALLNHAHSSGDCLILRLSFLNANAGAATKAPRQLATDT